MVEIGNEIGVEYNQEDYDTSLPLLKAYIKAEIAAMVWDEAGYYQVLNPVSNEIYSKALKLIDEAALLAEAY